jgi:hypothetical protein
MGDTRPRGRRPRVMLLAVLTMITVVMAVSVAEVSAHDPLILGPDDATPTDGPLLPDGTISFALYGVIEQPGESRAFRVRFAAGDPLRVTVLIPDLPPENSLTPDQLPTLELTRPDGRTSQFSASMREPFAEPFTGTNYITYMRVDETAEAGEYAFIVRGEVPARFTVAVGEKEQFGTPVEGVDNRAGGLTGVQAWYATSPRPVSVTETDTATDDGSAGNVAVEAYVTEASTASSTTALWVALGAIVAATLAAAAAMVMTRRARQPG